MLLPPDPHAVVAILVAAFAIFLYTRNRIPLEASSLAVLTFILVWFELFEIESGGQRIRANAFLAGFGNEALITVIALIVLARSLEVTRALQAIGVALARLWRDHARLALLATMLAAASLSMFLNNTPVVAALMPLLVAVSLQAGKSPSGILMPIGFATIVGGMATTIGTSTNLLVVGIAADMGVHEFGMFEFTLPVVIVGSFALLYLWLIAPGLLPERNPPMTTVAPRLFESRLLVKSGSAAAGKTITELRELTGGRMRIERLDRDGLILARLPSVMLRAGDLLYVTDTIENLKDYERALGATLLPVDDDQPVDADHPLASKEHLAEIVVMRGSALERSTLGASRILSQYGLNLLALHRSELVQRNGAKSAMDAVLRAGDVILLQGSVKGLERLKRSNLGLVLDGSIELPRPAKASLALAIMTAVIVFAATGFVRISQAAIAGVGLMLLTRCLTWNDVRGAIDRRIILVIVASLAIGKAMMVTGAAAYIANGYAVLFGDLPMAVILSGLILVMALLTEVATNNAIAVLGTPIAVNVAAALGAPPEPFVLAVLFGANMSYLTPVGYQTNLLVMSAGGYRFSDFWRAGVPLQIIMWIGLSALLPVLYDI